MIKNKEVDKNININQIKWFDFFSENLLHTPQNFN